MTLLGLVRVWGGKHILCNFGAFEIIMKKTYSTVLFLLLLLLISGFISCTSLSCQDETEAFLKISFAIKNPDGTDKLQPPDSITVYGLDMSDSKIYYNTAAVQPALLPLNSSAPFSEFIIRINGITDTVKFIYSTFPQLVSKECGYTFYHTLDTTRTFTCNAIKDLKVWNGNITTKNEENIRIYY